MKTTTTKTIRIANLVPAIIILRNEAAAAGDMDQVRVCDRALNGSMRARRECARVLRNALAQAE
jgi:hypothetical protein